MNRYLIKWCIFFISHFVLIRYVESNPSNGTSDENRNPRVSGRIVKLYSGYKPEPITCTEEGFRADPVDCSIFYRCIGAKSGKFSVLRFQCGPGTVFDPDTEVCNHPHSTKRSECGTNRPYQFLIAPVDQVNENNIDSSAHELPSPITTKKPLDVDQTSAWYRPSTVSSTSEYQSMTSFGYVTFTPDMTKPKELSTSKTSVASTPYPRSTSISSTNHAKLMITHSRRQDESLNECNHDGFMGDNKDCRKFYRCVNNQRGGFTKYDFMCSESTIWDDDIQSCNHPWAVRRSTCVRDVRGMANSNIDDLNFHKNKNISAEDLINRTTETLSSSTQTYYGDRINVNKANVVLNPNNLNIPSNAYVTENEYVTSKIQHKQTQPTSYYLDPLIQIQKQLYESTTKASTYVFGRDDSSHSTRNPSNKARDIKCTESGFMGDPNDCRKFYRCVQNGKDSYIKHEFLCGEGTAWDERAESCNHAWMVMKCGGKLLHNVSSTNKIDIDVNQTTPYPNIISEENSYNTGGLQSREPSALPVTTGMLLSPSDKGESIEICNSVGYKGSKTDCRKFYRCIENDNRGFTKLDYICDEGTLWDSNIEACNHAKIVNNCVVSANNASKFSTPSTESTIITTISFIQSTIQSSNIGYNDEVQEVSNYKESTPNIVLSTTDSKCQESGFMADQHDCRKFFRCVEKGNNSFIRFEYSCGDGTAWDARINACNHLRAVPTCGIIMNDYYNESTSSKLPPSESDENVYSYTTQVNKNSVNTVRTESTTSTNFDTKPTITNHKLNVCTRSGFFGDSSDCKKFYRCVSNNDGRYTRHEFSCGEGTVWDHEIEACNHAAAVNRCGGKPEAQIDVMTLPPQPPTTIHSVNDELDSGYIQIFDGSNSLSNNTLPSSSEYPQDFDKNQECNEVGLMADKNDCKKFYRCVENGQGGFIRFEFSCGDGTAWDRSIEACNHISSVKECASVSNDFSSTTLKSPQPAIPVHSTVASYPQHDDAPVTPKPTKENDDCMSEGFHGNKRDCKKFYRCVSSQQGGFIKFEFSCGDGTIWDQNIQACNHEYSDNLNCTVLSTSDSKPGPVIKPANNQETQDNTALNEISTTEKGVDLPPYNTCSSEGFYPNLEDCKKFIRCVNNGDGKYVRHDFTCGEGTIWVQDIQACDHDNDNSTCSSGILTSSEAYIVTTQSTQIDTSSTIQNVVTSGNIDSTENPVVTVSKNDECHSEGYYSNSNDCRRFYRCVVDDHGTFVKYDYICGEGTAWDLDTQSCNHIGSVKRCTSVQDSQTTTLVTNVAQPQTTENIKTTVLPTTSALQPQATESIKTTTALTTKITPPQTTENIKTTMASTTKIAQPQTTENIKTTIQQTSTPVVTSMQEDPSTTDNCRTEGYFGNKENCQKFYRCVNNGQGSYIKYDYICGDGTMWDPDILACNHPRDVKNPSCKEDSNTSPTSVSTESSVQPTESTSSSSQTPAYLTSKQTTVSSSEGSTQGTSNCSSSENVKNENMTCTKAGYYPNPDNCKKFYRCVDWDGDGQRYSIFHFECGEGTIWDPALDTCNYEDSVYPPRNCKDLQIQNGNTSSTSAVSIEENTTSSMSSETTTQTTQTTQQIASMESTTPQITSTESTTQQITSTESTTQQISSTKSTTQQTTSTESTTQQITSTKSSTQQITSAESTTQQISSTESTTQQITSTESTTQQQISTDTTTTQSTTTTEQSTTQQTTPTTETTTTDQITSVATSTTTEQPTTSEKATTESTTVTEQPISTSTEQSSTEQSTTETSQPSSTGQSTTTEETTSTTVQQSTELSTESSSSTTDNGTNTSTTESTPETTSTDTSSTNKCPETEKDQYLYACPTSFKRHPKYCNVFYQCIEDNDTHELKIAVFNCPNGTIYDELKIQCVEERNAQKKCEGTIAQKRRFKRLNVNNKEIITASKNTYRCPGVGHFPFEKNEECSPALLRCDISMSGKLRGFVYRCPENYVYWSISRKCEPISKMAHCKHSTSQWTKRTEIPIERKNVAY